MPGTSIHVLHLCVFVMHMCFYLCDGNVFVVGDVIKTEPVARFRIFFHAREEKVRILINNNLDNHRCHKTGPEMEYSKEEMGRPKHGWGRSVAGEMTKSGTTWKEMKNQRKIEQC